jgi:hypothetical protein
MIPKQHAVYNGSPCERPNSTEPQCPLTGIPKRTAQTAADHTVESGESSVLT